MTLSIIIPNYNGKNLLRGCLNSIYAHPPACEFEIIVVDDASEDESQKIVKNEFPSILLITNPKNKGFSYTVNRGMEKSCGKYILLLNNDTLVIDNSLDLMVQFMDRNLHVDVCGPRLLSPDNTPQRSTQTFPKLSREFFHANPFFKKIYRGERTLSHKVLSLLLKTFKTQWASFINYDKTTEVDVTTGAAFMFRRNVIDKIGYFDENYFMYVEESDYCYRLKINGGRVFYYHEAHIIHFLGQTTKQDFKKGYWIGNPFLIVRYKSMLYFFRKHYSKFQLYLLKLIMFEGHSLRLGFNFLKWLLYVKRRDEIKKVMEIYYGVIKLALHR